MDVFSRLQDATKRSERRVVLRMTVRVVSGSRESLKAIPLRFWKLARLAEVPGL